MLAIRLQRTGRSGHAQYRVIVQDAHKSPTSGRVVAYVGSYDPHAKTTTLKKEKVEFYLEHGAQPSDRVAGLLKKEGVKLPKWVTPAAPKKRTTRNPDKLAKEEKAAPAAEAPVETTEEKPVEAEAPAAEPQTEEEKPAEEAKTEEAAPDEKADEPAAEPEAEAPQEEPAEAEKSEEKPQEDTDKKPAEK